MRVFRHEWKYLISYGEFEAIKLRMNQCFRLDPNATNGEYLIRSLYFDDYFNSSYEEKNMGIQLRKKYRIRIYNYSDKSIKLERKIKNGKYIYKEAAELTRQQVYDLIDGKYDFLLESNSNLLKEFYYECTSNVMRPRVIVDYERVPYIMDGGTVRITFDKQVRAAVGGFDIFDKKLPTLGALPADKLIMEVKYTEFLPQMVRELCPPAASEFTAASKFVLCCDKTAYLVGSENYVEERYII